MYYIQSMYKLRVIKPQKNKNKNKNCNMHICKFVTCRFQTFTPTYLLYTANIGTIISCHSKHSKSVSSSSLYYYAPHNLLNFILKENTVKWSLFCITFLLKPSQNSTGQSRSKLQNVELSPFFTPMSPSSLNCGSMIQTGIVTKKDLLLLLPCSLLSSAPVALQIFKATNTKKNQW